MTGGARLARASGRCWVCRGWESGVERHPSRVILLPRVSCLAGVCIYRASTHSLSPKPFSLLSCQRPSLPGPTGMDRAQMEFPRTSGSLLNRVLGVPRSRPYRCWDTGQAACAYVRGPQGPSCSWATKCLAGQLCFAHPEGCFNGFPQTRH